MAEPLYPRQILLADDDEDDVLLFNVAIEQLMLPWKITNVRNGEKLMHTLYEKQPLPDLLFLDLNMPKQNGLDCLSAIKHTKKLQAIPVVIISTSCETNVVNQLYAGGAHYYICKPNDFTKLTSVIDKAILLTSGVNLTQPPRDKFVLYP